MMIGPHPNKTHEATCALAEMNRQSAVAAAIAAGGGSAAVATAVKAAETVFYRSILVSCKVNGINDAGFRQGLHDLAGVWE